MNSLKSTIHTLIFATIIPTLLVLSFFYPIIKTTQAANLSRSPAVMGKEIKKTYKASYSLKSNIYNYLITVK
jgi:hypothetical protein